MMRYRQRRKLLRASAASRLGLLNACLTVRGHAAVVGVATLYDSGELGR